MTDLVPMTYNDLYALAGQISRSPLIPNAYRGKPADTAIAMMYGQEVGIPPMASLQRINVIQGKPGLDAQGIVALVRGAGHSITGDISTTSATATGKRGDTGDEMTATFTIEDAKHAGLVKPGPWVQYPDDMLWAKAVTRLGRRLFADVLMGLSYTPDEIEDFTSPAPAVSSNTAGAPEVTQVAHVVQIAPPEPDVVDAEVVEPAPVPSTPPPALVDAGQAMAHLANLIRSQPPGQKEALRGHLIATFGPGSKMTEDQITEATIIAENWPPPSDEPLPVEPVDDEF